MSTHRKRMKALIEDIERYHAEKLSKSDEKEHERVKKLYEEILKGENNE